MPSRNTLEIIITANNQASSVLAGITKSAGRDLTKLGQSMAKTGLALTAATAPFVAGLAAAVQSASKFDEAMTNVGAVLGKSKDEMADISAQVLAIGAASRAGPQAAAEAFYDIVGGVADASTHMAILNAAIATAEAGSADLGATTSALIAIMNSYGFSADQAAFASDVLTQTVGAGVGSMEEFAAAMPQVAGLASSLGVSFDDLGASMAFLTTKGFSASQAATQLRAMMVAMLNPNEAMKTSLQEAGFASGELAIQQLGLVGAFQALSSESPTFQSNMAGAVGSVEALNGVIALTDEGFQQFADDFKSSAEGATDAARAIQMDSFAAQLDLAKSSVEALKIQIGTALLPVLNDLLVQAQPIIQSIIEWAGANPELVASLGKLAAGLAAAGVTMTLVGGALSTVGTLLAALNPPMLIGLALAAAYATNFGGLKDAISDTTTAIQEGDTVGALEGIGQALLSIPRGIAKEIVGKEAWEEGIQGLNTFVDSVKILPEALATAIGSMDMTEILSKGFGIADTLMNGITKQISLAGGRVITKLAEALGIADLLPVIENAAAIGTSILEGILNPIDFVDFVLNSIIIPLGSQIYSLASTVAGYAAEIGAQILQGILNSLSNIGQAILDLIKEQLGSIDVGSAIEGAIGIDIPGLAAGGSVRTGQAYIVGERGAELFVPSTSGRIVPNHQLGTVSGGGTAAGGTQIMNLNDANIVLPGVTNARQFFDELEREAKRRNRGFAPGRVGVQ